MKQSNGNAANTVDLIKRECIHETATTQHIYHQLNGIITHKHWRLTGVMKYKCYA